MALAHTQTQNSKVSQFKG